MTADDLLVLGYDGFSKRLKAFYATLGDSAAHRELFIKDPTRTLHAGLFADFPELGEGEINQANRVLFALLSNKGFMRWAGEYQKRLDREMRAGAKKGGGDLRAYAVTMDRQKIYEDFVEGALKHVDHEMLYAIFVSQRERVRPVNPGDLRIPETAARQEPDPIGPISSFWVAAETFVAVIAVVLFHIVVTQIDATPRVAEHLSRTDIQRVSAHIAEGIQARAADLRESGALRSFDAASRGRAL